MRDRHMRYADIVRLFEITGAEKLEISVDTPSILEKHKNTVQICANGDIFNHNRGIVSVKWTRSKKHAHRGSYTYEFLENRPFVGKHFDGNKQMIEDETLIAEMLILTLKVHRQSNNEAYHVTINKRSDYFTIEYHTIETRTMRVYE